MNSVHYRSQSDEWQTPFLIWELLYLLDDCPFDPCPHSHADDGCAYKWPRKHLVYVNPPYSDLRRWLNKCVHEAAYGAEIIALVPSRTDTRAWHSAVPTADAVCFWRGRLRFVGAEASAPFPSALIYWGPGPGLFARVFEDYGLIWLPNMS